MALGNEGKELLLTGCNDLPQKGQKLQPPNPALGVPLTSHNIDKGLLDLTGIKKMF